MFAALDPKERAELTHLPIGEDFYLKQTGVPALFGEEGYTSLKGSAVVLLWK